MGSGMTLQAQSSKIKKALCKKWRIDFEETMNRNLAPEMKQMIESMPEDQKKAMTAQLEIEKAKLARNYFLFKKDGTVEVHSVEESGETKTEEGKWELSNDDKTFIMIKDKDGEKKEMEIHEIADAKLIFKITGEEEDGFKYLALMPF